ncbi:uncharacterized protein LOC132397159 isoform X3 [Hypanus sabinus]|uniref:uncharacterized protein LOC132397159 isoform X3 n=1 Tax=Hypanus sabinus TaxID=79690 RepID=UPI0028C47D8E|nr:uncharacterized protein LOC132397159 isoform X3 [Hypanus sabinus]
MDMGAQRNIGKFQEDLLRCCCCCEVRDSPGKNKPPVLGVALPTAVGNAILIRSTEDGARRSCVGGDGRRLGGSMGSESAAVRSLLVCAASARLGSTELPLCTAPARLSRAVQWKSIAGVLPSAAGVGWRVCRDPGDLWKLCGHLELLVSYSASSIHSSTGGSKGQSFHKNLHMRPVVSIIISYCGEREGSTGKLGAKNSIKNSVQKQCANGTRAPTPTRKKLHFRQHDRMGENTEYKNTKSKESDRTTVQPTNCRPRTSLPSSDSIKEEKFNLKKRNLVIGIEQESIQHTTRTNMSCIKAKWI